MEAVAVYSDADAAALHVRLADAAVRIGPPAPTESYLRIDAIIEAALDTGAEAIHPGYGFLAERAAFARAVEDAGLVFIGPPSAAIDALGDKLHARRTARDVGVAAVPGTLEPAPVDRPDQVARDRRRGRGDRLSACWSRPPPAVVAAGCGGSWRPRSCRPPSPMDRARRPRPSVTDRSTSSARSSRRATSRSSCWAMPQGGSWRSASATARSSGVTRSWSRRRRRPGCRRTSAATCTRWRSRSRPRPVSRTPRPPSSCAAPDGSFWFLEVNTRLQVEHGVTELVSGLDIVREQFWLAAGRPLSDEALAAADTGRRADRARDRGPDRGRGPVPRLRPDARPGPALGDAGRPGRPGRHRDRGRRPGPGRVRQPDRQDHGPRRGPRSGHRAPAPGARRDRDRRHPDDPAVPPVRGPEPGLRRRPSSPPAGSRSTGMDRRRSPEPPASRCSRPGSTPSRAAHATTIGGRPMSPAAGSGGAGDDGWRRAAREAAIDRWPG